MFNKIDHTLNDTADVQQTESSLHKQSQYQFSPEIRWILLTNTRTHSGNLQWKKQLTFVVLYLHYYSNISNTVISHSH